MAHVRIAVELTGDAVDVARQLRDLANAFDPRDPRETPTEPPASTDPPPPPPKLPRVDLNH